MPIRERRKGQTGEREFVNMLKGWGLRCERVPGSGAYAYQGEQHDATFYLNNEAWSVEIKRHKSPLKTITKWRGHADVLATRADQGEWQIHLSVDAFRNIVTLLDELLREREK